MKKMTLLPSVISDFQHLLHPCFIDDYSPLFLIKTIWPIISAIRDTRTIIGSQIPYASSQQQHGIGRGPSRARDTLGTKASRRI